MFHLCRDNFRKEYKENHPDIKKVSVIGKAGGEKWKSMSDAISCTSPLPSLLPLNWVLVYSFLPLRPPSASVSLFVQTGGAAR